MKAVWEWTVEELKAQGIDCVSALARHPMLRGTA